MMETKYLFGSILIFGLLLISGCKEEPQIAYCYYLDLENKQMPAGWNAIDFGYDETYCHESDCTNWFDNHLGVVTQKGIFKNFCNIYNNKEFSNVIMCGDKFPFDSRGKSEWYIGIHHFIRECEKGCNNDTGLCKK